MFYVIRKHIQVSNVKINLVLVIVKHSSAITYEFQPAIRIVYWIVFSCDLDTIVIRLLQTQNRC